jgi:carboxymethylenebutenolidase
VELPEEPAGRERGFELLRTLTRPTVLADLGGCFGYLRTGGERVGMVGMSLGGHVAYLAATEFDLAAVVVSYGGWLPSTDIALSQPTPTLERTPGIRGRLLMLLGEQDPVISPEQRHEIAAALRAAGVRHEIVAYPGLGHGFLNRYRDSYDPAADADAWQWIASLLRDELG